MERRDVIIKILQASAAALVPVFVSCSKDEEDDLPAPGSTLTIDLDSGQYSTLNTAGGAMIFNNVIVANTGNDAFVALSAICTHEGCVISYNHSAGNFPCPCHGSVFSTSGSVLQGPAPTAVRSYQITREGNVLTINF